MKGDGSEILKLIKVFETYAELHLKKDSETNQRMDYLAKTMKEMGDKLSTFIGIMAISEERHTNHAEKSSRIEKNQTKQIEDFKEYKEKIDDRMMLVEKQILLLDTHRETFKRRWDAVDKRNATIVVALISTAIVTYFGLK